MSRARSTAANSASHVSDVPVQEDAASVPRALLLTCDQNPVKGEPCQEVYNETEPAEQAAAHLRSGRPWQAIGSHKHFQESMNVLQCMFTTFRLSCWQEAT